MPIEQEIAILSVMSILCFLASRIVENWRSDGRAPWFHSIFLFSQRKNETYLKRNSRVVLTMIYLGSSLTAFVWVILMVAFLFVPPEEVQGYLLKLIDNMN